MTPDQEAAELTALLHKLNQPLTAIGNYAQAGRQLLDKGLRDTEALAQLFDKIAAQAGRTVAISRELRELVQRPGRGREDG